MESVKILILMLIELARTESMLFRALKSNITCRIRNIIY